MSGDSSTFYIKKPVNFSEWKEYHRIRQNEIFSDSEIEYDTNHPTLTDKHHHHFLFFRDKVIIGTVQIELPDIRNIAIIRPFAIDRDQKNKGYGTILLKIVEKWILDQGYKEIHLHANPAALTFYKRNGYKEMDFPLPDKLFQDSIDLGKIIEEE